MKSNTLVTILMALTLTSCGEAITGKKGNSNQDETSPEEQVDGEGEKNQFQNSQKVIRLKDKSLMIKSLVYLMGPGFDKDINDTESSIFERYGSQFGDNEGLEFGEIFDDEKTEAKKKSNYLLAQNIVANNTALHCTIKLQNAKEGGNDHERCQCETKEQAKSMFGRAYPHLDSEDEQYAFYVENLAKVCKSNRGDAIRAVMSSILYAIRF